MKYVEINRAILADRDVDDAVIVKDASFYTYLLNNKVAYLYAKNLSEVPTKTEAYIINQFEKFNQKYVDTLKVVKTIADANNIIFLLYKTHKYIPDLNDGDIDIFVQQTDFQRFLKVMSDNGFDSVEDEPGKGKCIKKGLAIVEPHISISWRGGSYVSEAFIWMNPTEIVIADQRYKTASYEIELISLIGKVLFEPSYFDLNSIKALRYFRKTADDDKILEYIKFEKEYVAVLRFLSKIDFDKNIKAPVFLNTTLYLKLWTRQFKNVKSIRTYCMHIIFFLYWKYRYYLVSKLPYTHHDEW